MKAEMVLRKVYDYIRYDLKKIAFPSSSPNLPHVKKYQKLTWTKHYLVLKEASRLYAANWIRDNGPELRPYKYKKHHYREIKPGLADKTERDKEPSTFEDLAVAAIEMLRHTLQGMHMTRASSSIDALRSFIEGYYQQGIQQVMEKKESLESQFKQEEEKALKDQLEHPNLPKKKKLEHPIMYYSVFLSVCSMQTCVMILFCSYLYLLLE